MYDSNTISRICYVQSAVSQAGCGSLHPKATSVRQRSCSHPPNHSSDVNDIFPPEFRFWKSLRTSTIFFRPSFASGNTVTYLWRLTIRCRSCFKWRLITSTVYQLQRNYGLKKINCERIRNNQVPIIMPFITGSVVQS